MPIILTLRSRQEIADVARKVILWAPDFDYEIWLRPEHRTTMESAYTELRQGVDTVFANPKFDGVRRKMHDMLDQTYDDFLAGERKPPINMMHEFIELVSSA